MVKTEVLPNGYTVDLLDDSSFIINEIWNEQCYTNHFDIDKGDFVVDIGANQGLFTLFAASKGAHVVSVEPVPELFALLQKNINRNSVSRSVSPHNIAITKNGGRCQMFLPETHEMVDCGFSTAVEQVANEFKSITENRFRTIDVNAINFNALLAPFETIDFLKIDCEGCEWEILESASTETLSKVTTIVMETHAGYSEKMMFRLLQSHGFTIVEFRQIPSPFRDGFIAATKKDSVQSSKPLFAQFIVPSDVQIGDTIYLNASESFGINPNDVLKCHWNIASSQGTIVNSELSDFSFQPEYPDAFYISLTVSDLIGNSATMNKWIFVRNFAQEMVNNRVILEEEYWISKIDVEKSTQVVIPRIFLPKFWDYQGVTLTIATMEKTVPLAGTLKFNGKSFSLDGFVKEIELGYTPPHLDVDILLEMTHRSSLSLQWRIEADISNFTANFFQSSTDKIYLKPEGQITSIQIPQGESTIVINRQNIPSEWAHEKLILQMYDESSDAKLSGTVSLGNEIHTVSEWNHTSSWEFCSYLSKKEDVELNFDLREARTVSIRWVLH